MSLQTVVESLQGTHAEVLAAVQARTVTQVGAIPGAQLGATLLGLGVGLIGFIADKAAAIGTSSLIRDICIGLTDRFKPDGEVDFSDAANVALIDAFLADAEVAALLGQIPSATVKDAILARASTVQPEFPGVTLRDIITIREPALAQSQTTSPIAFAGISQKLKLTLAADLPETVNAYAEISDDGIEWRRVQTDGLQGLRQATTRTFRVLPGPLAEANTQIRVTVPYSVGATLA